MGRVGVGVGVMGFVLLSGCGLEKPESDQIAQSEMIGLPKKKILICMGKPARRHVVGSTEIWSYPVGTVEIEGQGFATFGYPRHTACEVKVVLTNGVTSEVDYAGLAGDPLDLGERCSFAARSCVWSR